MGDRNVKGIKGGAERMKAKLTLSDRFAALSVLPAEGNFATLKLIRKLREQLSLTEAEIKDQKVIQNGDQITWEKGEKTTEMEFGEFAENMIKEHLKKMNEANKLEDSHFAIYEMFVEGIK